MDERRGVRRQAGERAWHVVDGAVHELVRQIRQHDREARRGSGHVVEHELRRLILAAAVRAHIHERDLAAFGDRRARQRHRNARLVEREDVGRGVNSTIDGRGLVTTTTDDGECAENKKGPLHGP